jgi:spermidine synthase
MIDGFEYDNLLKIWFLNTDVKKKLEKYKENFDVVIVDDWNMKFVNDVLAEILK